MINNDYCKLYVSNDNRKYKISSTYNLIQFKHFNHIFFCLYVLKINENNNIIFQLCYNVKDTNTDFNNISLMIIINIIMIQYRKFLNSIIYCFIFINNIL